MTFKPVGIDENSLFPPRVEERLEEQFAPMTGMTKSYVGLGNVDNTSDANKPVSTPAQTALNLKAPLASPAFTGSPTSTNDFEVLTTGKGFVLKSPNGTRYRLVVSNAGVLTTLAI